MAKFEDLSDDVLYLIINHFSSQRLLILHYFRLVSKHLSAFADSVLYRDIVLEEHNENQGQMSYRFIERLLDPLDALRCHVRSLHVRSFEGDDQSSCMNIELLVACLQNIRKLHSFSWNNKIPLPDNLLHALHQHHSGAQLCVSSRQVDQAVFSSPQLRCLTISIPCSEVISQALVAPFEQLKRTIVNNGNLRALTIDIHQDLSLRQAEEAKALELSELPQATSDGMSELDIVQLSARASSTAQVDDPRSTGICNRIQICLGPTEQLPPLEELSIQTIAYEFDREHCVQLHRSMEWTNLRRLRLGSSNPRNFFEVFTGKLPLLTHLDVSFHAHSRSYFYEIAQASLSECATFVTSLRTLKALFIRCDLINFSDRFWHALVKAHGKHLQHLSIQPRFKGLEAPTYQNSLHDFLSSFTGLRTLELALLKVDGACNRCLGLGSFAPTHTSNTDYVRQIPFLATLETLRLSMRIAPFNESSLHQSMAVHAQCAIMKVWTFYENRLQHYDRPYELIPYDLEVFSIDFWRWETPSAHAVKKGTPPVAHINRVVFESIKQEDQLVIRAREGQKTVKTYYSVHDSFGTAYVDSHGYQRLYYPAEPHVLGQPFMLPDRLHDSQGYIF